MNVLFIIGIQVQFILILLLFNLSIKTMVWGQKDSTAGRALTINVANLSLIRGIGSPTGISPDSSYPGMNQNPKLKKQIIK